MWGSEEREARVHLQKSGGGKHEVSQSGRWPRRLQHVWPSLISQCAIIYYLSSQHKRECSNVHSFASQEHSAREELQKLFHNCLGKQQALEEENSLNISKCNKVICASSFYQRIIFTILDLHSLVVSTSWRKVRTDIKSDICVNPKSDLVFAGLVSAHWGQ